MSRLDIPDAMRRAQLWGATADVDVAGNVSVPSLVRVQLDSAYERDWTVHLASPIFRTGAPLIGAGPGIGMGPSVDNVDVIVRYGGGRGVPQEVWLDYPCRGRTIGVRGCYVEVLTRPHVRAAVAKDPARLFAELVDAPPPSLTFEALPTFTGDVVESGPVATFVPVPPRAVAVMLVPVSSATSVAAWQVVANSASLAEYLGRGGTAGATMIVEGAISQSEWFHVPATAQGLSLLALAGVASLTPIWKIAP